MGRGHAPAAPKRGWSTVMATERMLDRGDGMARFLGVAADSRLLNQDRFNLPAAEQRDRKSVV